MTPLDRCHLGGETLVFAMHALLRPYIRLPDERVRHGAAHRGFGEFGI